MSTWADSIAYLQRTYLLVEAYLVTNRIHTPEIPLGGELIIFGQIPASDRANIVAQVGGGLQWALQ